MESNHRRESQGVYSARPLHGVACMEEGRRIERPSLARRPRVFKTRWAPLPGAFHEISVVKDQIWRSGPFPTRTRCRAIALAPRSGSLPVAHSRFPAVLGFLTLRAVSMTPSAGVADMVEGVRIELTISRAQAERDTASLTLFGSFAGARVELAWTGYGPVEGPLLKPALLPTRPARRLPRPLGVACSMPHPAFFGKPPLCFALNPALDVLRELLAMWRFFFPARGHCRLVRMHPASLRR